ncbi:MerR family transcriptional regulator [Chloroflexota bacterium]
MKKAPNRQLLYDTEPDTIMTTSEVAVLLHINVNTVRRWGQRGVLQVYRIGSRGDRRLAALQTILYPRR